MNLPVETHYQGIPLHRFPFVIEPNNITQVAELRQRIVGLKRAFAADLVHINGVAIDNFFHLVTANVHPAPLLVTLHGEWWSQADSLVHHILHNADWVTGCSAAALLRGQQLAPEIIPRSSVILNALEAPRLLPEPLPVQAPRLLCLGRLVPEKGFDVALSAFATVVQRFPHARLVIAGDGPARADLERQAMALGLREAVEFLGWVAPPEVPALLNTVTLLVMPSRWEGLPLVALEAALMARPVIATRVGGLQEVVIPGQTGLLVEPGDNESLTEALTFLLRDPQAAIQMGQAAWQRAKDLFSFTCYVDAYDALYQKVCAGKGRASQNDSKSLL